MRFTRKTIPTFLFIILITSALSTLIISQTRAQIYPVIYVSPKVSYAAPGETVNVSIMISNIYNLYGYQVYLYFSNEILEAQAVTEGDFLKRGAYEPFWVPKANNTAGEIAVWEALLSPDPDVSGNGELFKITFLVKKTGDSVLHIDHDLVMMNNQWRAPIAPFDTVDGGVSTAKLEFTPDVLRGAEYVPGRSFDVNLTLNGTLENLYGYDLNVSYGKDVLNATQITLLALLEMPNTNFTEINNTQGFLLINLTCTEPASSINVTGTIATITFQVLSVGSTEIEIENSTLVDRQGNRKVHAIGKASFSGVVRNIRVIGVSISSLQAVAGDNLTLNITAGNEGSLNETFSITVYAKNNITALIGGPSEYTIGGLENETITMTLGTTGLDGNYTVYIFMSYVPDETNLQDNEYTYASQLSVTPKALEAGSIFGTTFYLALILIVIILIIVGIFYMRRRH